MDSDVDFDDSITDEMIEEYDRMMALKSTRPATRPAPSSTSVPSAAVDSTLESSSSSNDASSSLPPPFTMPSVHRDFIPTSSSQLLQGAPLNAPRTTTNTPPRSPSTNDQPPTRSVGDTGANNASMEQTSATSNRLEALREAARSTDNQPFFTGRTTNCPDEDDDDDLDADLDADFDADNDDEEDRQPRSSKRAAECSSEAWFKKPKNMSTVVYDYFRDTIQPYVQRKSGRNLTQPASFHQRSACETSTLWIIPQDPVFALSKHRFEPSKLWRPRVYLWLPHFLVEKVLCPHCRNEVLEKNGMLRPRRILDMEDYFYILTWGYYCRKGCKKYSNGWGRPLLNSLPAYIRQAFPAVLSRRGGVSIRVARLLRVANQHKMGASGVRALLLELHTARFDTLRIQYLESVLEYMREREAAQALSGPSIRDHFQPQHVSIPSFGNFSDREGYNGYVADERTLSRLLIQLVEQDESDANQHTSCLPLLEQLELDDSHKITKHCAKEDGLSLFNALWTCMASYYIKAQALTLTKSHEERIGPLTAIASSARRFGFNDPQVVYSDDPVKDKSLLYAAFPSLAENLTPMAEAHGHTQLDLPPSVQVEILETRSVVDTALSPHIASLDDNDEGSLVVFLDAEWNTARTIGVSILQLAFEGDSSRVFIIPIYLFENSLPNTLLRLLVNDRVFKVGSGVRGDFTRLQKQFPMLRGHGNSCLIDLKDYAIQRDVITRKESGSLAALCLKVLSKYLHKDDSVRRSDGWENTPLSALHRDYAALDVYAVHLVYAELSKLSPRRFATASTPSGTRIALLVQEGGSDVAAYGSIADEQPASFKGVRVAVPTCSRLVVEIDDIRIPAAASTLHYPPGIRISKAKTGTLTLRDLAAQSTTASGSFKMVAPVSQLLIDIRSDTTPASRSDEVVPKESSMPTFPAQPLYYEYVPDDSHPESAGSTSSLEEDMDLSIVESTHTELQLPELDDRPDALSPNEHDFLVKLQNLVESHSDAESVYSRVKKDLFHAFDMIPLPTNHGLRPAFSRALRDHMMRWDHTAWMKVDAVCQEKFHISAKAMLLRCPRFITARVPRHVPSPNVLVPALKHVFTTFGSALDAKTGKPLFGPPGSAAWKKSDAVLELAREGYLSDLPGIKLYEKDSVDQYGLQTWKCLRGTGVVEGGPHSDIYKKFAPLNAGARLTVACLTDHRTWYNLQAYARHVFSVDWEYHHDLKLMNRTHFLLNYLSDHISGALAYQDWVNGDLYEQTDQSFGICAFPANLRDRYGMQAWSETAAATFKLSSNLDWLRRRQGLALPTFPPNSSEARQYFFTEMRNRTLVAARDGGKVNMDTFAQDWNSTADGTTRMYVTPDILSAYARTWDKTANIKTSQDLISTQMNTISKSATVFAAADLPFPSDTMGDASREQPSAGVRSLTAEDPIPVSLSTELAISRPMFIPDPEPGEPATPPVQLDRSDAEIVPRDSACTSTPNTPPMDDTPADPLTLHDNSMSDGEIADADASQTTSQPPAAASASSKRRNYEDIKNPHTGKRQRKTKVENRRRAPRKCRRCQSEDCPGHNDRRRCLAPCIIPCRKCGQTQCYGADGAPARDCRPFPLQDT